MVFHLHMCGILQDKSTQTSTSSDNGSKMICSSQIILHKKSEKCGMHWYKTSVCFLPLTLNQQYVVVGGKIARESLLEAAY